MGFERNFPRTQKSISPKFHFGFLATLLSIGLMGWFIGRPAQQAHAAPAILARTLHNARVMASRFAPAALVSGTITGTVYLDYNQNGALNTSGTAPNLAIDTGVSGVVVTAYDSSGVNRGTATTGASGTYSLSATGTGPYRIEFTALPSGYYPSAIGTNNATTVRFVPDGNSSGVDLGIGKPSLYSQNNPLVTTSCYINGSNTGADDVLVALNYDRTGSVQHIGLANQIGSTWGLAWQRKTKKLLAAAFLKRHSAFGPGKDGTRGNADDHSTVYVIDYSTPGTNGAGTINSSQTFDVSALGVSLGSNPRLGTTPTNDISGTGTTQASRDYGVFANVGKRGIGALALSEDENTLYLVNLNSAQPQLVSLNVSNIAGGVTLNSTVDLPAANTLCPGTDSLAPWAVKVNNGNVYVGAVCTADVSQNAQNLRAYVLQLSGSSFTQVDLDATTANNYIQLYYDRTFGYYNGSATTGRAEWAPWIATFPTNIVTTYGKTLATPIVSDIEFAPDGSISLGIMDRTGHQIGYGNYSESSTSTTLYDYISAGDVLKVCNFSGSFVPEGKTSGANTCTRSVTQPFDAPDGSDPAPGAAGIPIEFFNDNSAQSGTDGHGEIFFGGSGAIPGVRELVITGMNPFATYHAGGWRWLGTVAGVNNAGFQLYQNTVSSSPEATFGKSNGLGDVVILSDPAPLQIGNRIWADANANGVQEPGENGVSSVSVQLWADTNSDSTVDTQVGTATTDSNGNYYFGGANNTNMLGYSCSTTTTISVRVNASSDDAEENGGGTVSTTSNNLDLAYTGGGSPTQNIVGLRFNNLAIPVGAIISSATLQFTASSGDTANTVNLTIRGQANANSPTFTTTANDLSGRATTSASVNWSALGSWTNGATTNATSPDLSTVIQEVVNTTGWASGNSLNLLLRNNASTAGARRRGSSYDNSTTQAPLLSITYSTCKYSVNPTTKYEVRVPSTNFSTGQPLNGYVLTDVNADSSANGDARDTDATYSGGNVAITLTTGTYGENNHTYDFGFTTASTVSLGNRVWNDTDNDGALDAGETGLANVTVNLYNAAGSTLLGTTTTDSSGYYSFAGLTTATDYVVELAASNFNSGGALEGYRSSLTQPNGTETAAPDPDTGGASASDTDDNGLTSGTLGSGGVIRALAVTLTAGSEPTGETNGAGDLNVDNRSNLTVDFGLYAAYTVGNRVWRDNGAGGGTASNGTLDGSELGISGVTVGIYADANANGVADGAALATVVTDSSGYFRFDGLAAGSYVVGLPSSNFGSGQPLSGLVSTTTTGTSSSNSTDSRDNGVDNGTPGTNGIFSGTFNLATKTIPTGESDNQTPGTYGSGSTVNGPAASNNRGDLTIDFGFIVSAPLAARLSGFSAQTQSGTGKAGGAGGVVVRWQTGLESDNLGFNLYRESGGVRVRVNPTLIAGSALLAKAGTLLTAGQSYVWPDAQGAVGTVYWLEALDLSGAREWFGPLLAERGANAASSTENSTESSAAESFQRARLLEELNVLAPATVQPVPLAAVSPGAAITARTSAARVLAGGISVPWTLPGQTAAKLLVRQAGWYRVTAAELQAAGFNAQVNPALLQLFSDGVEVPITVQGQGNRVESLEFYGQGLDTPSSDTRVYWLVVGAQAGRRWPVAAAAVAESYSATSFVATVERRDKLIYFSGLLNGDAENWFGPVINGTGVTQRLTTPGVQRQALPSALLEVSLQGVTEQAHTVNLEFNGRTVGTAHFSGKERFTASYPVPLEALREGANEVRLVATGGASDISLSEALRLNYARSYVALEDQLQCSLVAGQTAYLSGFSTPRLRVLELGPGPEEVRELTVKPQADAQGGYGFGLHSAGGGVYVVLSEARLARVAGVKLNQPSQWRALTNAAEFVIVTHRDFWAAAQRLAALRRASDMRVAVVDIEDVYDEFSYGARTPQALKDLLSYARTYWLRKPSYALLLGDASTDPRNYLGAGEADYVPTYLGATSHFETALDNWLVDANEDGVPEYALGRLPVRTAAQAELAVSKTLAYKLPTSPRNSLFVADRTVDGVNFQAASEQLAGQLPVMMMKQFINRNDGAAGQVREQIVKSINLTGPLVVNWQGHGSTQVWTGDGLLRTQDAAGLTNPATGLYVLTTCLNGYFADPQQQSLGEALLLNTAGGAFAVVASSALNQPGSQQRFNLLLYQYLFGKGLSLGEALQQARAAVPDADVRNTYILFGDPTLRLSGRR